MDDQYDLPQQDLGGNDFNNQEPTQQNPQEPAPQQDNNQQVEPLPGLGPTPDPNQPDNQPPADNENQQPNPQELPEEWNEMPDNVKALAQGMSEEQRTQFKEMVDQSVNTLTEIETKSNQEIAKRDQALESFKPFYDSFQLARQTNPELYQNATPEMFSERMETFVNLEKSFQTQPAETMAKMLYQLVESNPQGQGQGENAIAVLAQNMQNPEYVRNLIAYAKSQAQADVQVQQQRQAIKQARQQEIRKQEIRNIMQDPQFGKAYNSIMQSQYGQNEFKAQYSALRQQYPMAQEAKVIKQSIIRTLQIINPNALNRTGQNKLPPNSNSGNSRTQQPVPNNNTPLDQNMQPTNQFNNIVEQIVAGTYKG